MKICYHIATGKLLVIALLCVLAASCSKYETYAEQKEAESDAINAFIAKNNINVISESTFFSNGNVTDVSRNEYVLFASSGVYMQIVRKGCGEKLKKGETATVLCRFSERNIKTDSLVANTNGVSYRRFCDKMNVTNTLGNFTASFISGESWMADAYKTTSVPSGWLVPLAYINIGRPTTEDEEIAKVNLIIPHSQGHARATQYVYPCYYEITYERGL